METIFTIENTQIEALESKEATLFFRSLLWAEARRLGIPLIKINISLWINVPDGGIDASVSEVELNLVKASGLIKNGQTSYQLKTGKSFKPWQSSQIEKELFKKNRDKKKENLGESVRDCLNKNGTYVLICFGLELTDQERKKAVDNIISYFKACNYKNPKVEVWGQSDIIGFCQIFPSLTLRFKGFDKYIFQSFESWSLQDDMRQDFKSGIEQKDFTENLQKELRENNKAKHNRLRGEPGIGKTRLVLEAVSAEDLAPLVIYCDSPNRFQDSYLMYENISYTIKLLEISE